MPNELGSKRTYFFPASSLSLDPAADGIVADAAVIVISMVVVVVVVDPALDAAVCPCPLLLGLMVSTLTTVVLGTGEAGPLLLDLVVCSSLFFCFV